MMRCAREKGVDAHLESANLALFFFKWMEGKRESRLELKCLPIELIDGGGGFCGDDR